MNTFLLLFPPLWLAVIGFGFGVIIGSFLNVYIYRFHTGKSLSGHSHCLSCGTPLHWYELFPLISFLWLRARCRTCGCSIPWRYFLVEFVTGALFAFTVLLTTNLLFMLGYWFVFAVLVIIVVYDLYHMIIPDSLTLALGGGVTVLLALSVYAGQSTYELGWDLIAAALGAAFFLFLWLISKGAWIGFGDVKLALPLALLVGAELVFSMVVLSFWLGAGISLFIIAVERVRQGKTRLHFAEQTLTMKSAVPFAPFLVASAILTLLTSFNVLSLFSFL